MGLPHERPLPGSCWDILRSAPCQEAGPVFSLAIPTAQWTRAPCSLRAASVESGPETLTHTCFAWRPSPASLPDSLGPYPRKQVLLASNPHLCLHLCEAQNTKSHHTITRQGHQGLPLAQGWSEMLQCHREGEWDRCVGTQQVRQGAALPPIPG